MKYLSRPVLFVMASILLSAPLCPASANPPVIPAPVVEPIIPEYSTWDISRRDKRYSNRLDVTISLGQAQNQPHSIEFSADDLFTSPTVHPYSGGAAKYPFTFPPGPDGERVVFARGVAEAGYSPVTSGTILLDLTPPTRPTLTQSVMTSLTLEESIDYEWSGSTDAESGILGYERRYPFFNGVWIANAYNFSSSFIDYQFTDPTLPGVWHGHAFRAVDRAGNRSEWAESMLVKRTLTETPSQSGAEVIQANLGLAGMATSDVVQVALLGVRGVPLEVEVAENPDFLDSTTMPYPDVLSPIAEWGYDWRVVDFHAVDRGLRVGVEVLHGRLIRAWDLWRGEIMWERWHTANLASVAIRDDLGAILFITSEGRPTFFDIEGNLLSVRPNISWRDERPSYVPGSSKVILRVWSGRVEIWETEPVEFLYSPGPFYSITDREDPSGQWLVLRNFISNRLSQEYLIYKIETGNLEHVIEILIESQNIESSFFDPTGSRFYVKWVERAIPHYQRYLGVWDLQTGEKISTTAGPWVPFDMEYLDEDRFIMVEGRSHPSVYDAMTQAYNIDFSQPGKWFEVDQLARDRRRVSCFAGNFSLLAGYDPVGGSFGMIFDTGPRVEYTLRDTTPGAKRLYVRMRNQAGPGNVVEADFTLHEPDRDLRRHANVLAYLAGHAPRRDDLDANRDGRVDIADAVMAASRPIELTDLPASIASGASVELGWRRTHEAGTAHRLELWRDRVMIAPLAEIHGESFAGRVVVTFPELDSGTYTLRLCSIWLESQAAPNPCIEYPLSIAP